MVLKRGFAGWQENFQNVRIFIMIWIHLTGAITVGNPMIQMLLEQLFLEHQIDKEDSINTSSMIKIREFIQVDSRSFFISTSNFQLILCWCLIVLQNYGFYCTQPVLLWSIRWIAKNLLPCFIRLSSNSNQINSQTWSNS